MNTYSHKFFTSMCFDHDMDLIGPCILPDEDEAGSGFSCHFYNPVTRKCYLGTEDSAKNRFIWHLSHYLRTFKKEYLGRAIHYLEDMCTPVHTQYEDAIDAAIRLNLHVNFEKKLDEYIKEHDNFHTIIEFNSIYEVLKYCPCKAAELYYKYRDGGETTSIFESVVDLTTSALFLLKHQINSKKIVSKFFTKKGEEINALFEDGRIFPSCLNTNFCLRYNGCNNVTVFYRDNKVYNFNFLCDLISD